MRKKIALICLGLIGLAMHLNPGSVFQFSSHHTSRFLGIWLVCNQIFIIPILLVFLAFLSKTFFGLLTTLYAVTIAFLSLATIFEVFFRSVQLNTWSLALVVFSTIFSVAILVPKPIKTK